MMNMGKLILTNHNKTQQTTNQEYISWDKLYSGPFY